MNNIAKNTNVKIRVVSKELNTDNSSNMWFIHFSTSGWDFTQFELDNYGNQYFTSRAPGNTVKIDFTKGEYILYYYEPANAVIPAFLKTLVILD
jgi:hypothetical protein